MNPGKLNHRIRFAEMGSTVDGYGGRTETETPVTCSQSATPNVTWGSLEPIKQYNQLVVEGSASVLNGDKILIIRYRDNWQPKKDMVFYDLNNAPDSYIVHSITPYYPGTKSNFQNAQENTYKDQNYIFILGTKRS